MNVTPRIQLPQPPAGSDPAVREYLVQLNGALARFAQAVYTDLAQGRSTLTPVTAAPAATTLDEGQVVVRTDTGNEALYVKVAGAVKTVALT